MTIFEESNIRYALHTGDNRLLADTVRHMTFPDFAEIREAVESTPGGWQHLGGFGDEIRLGDTRVIDQFGRAVVR